METIQTGGNHAIDIAWLKLLPKTNPLPPVVPIPTPHGDLAFGWRTPWHQAAPSTLGGRHPVPLAPPTSRGRFKQQIRRITSTGGSHPPPSPISAPVAAPCTPRRGSCGTVHPIMAPDLYPTVAAPVALVHLVAVAMSSGNPIGYWFCGRQWGALPAVDAVRMHVGW